MSHAIWALVSSCTPSGLGHPLGQGPLVCADGSGAHADLQDAIDAASPGDTLFVCPGTYGPIEVPWGLDVIVLSTDGPEVTTIDGGSDHAVFVNEGTLTLSGFTLTGTGRTAPGTDHGGAFTVHEGELSVDDCVVTGVTGSNALVFDEDLLVMDHVTWIGNETERLWFLWQGDDAVFSDNVVTGGVHEHLILTARLDQLHVRNSAFHDVEIDAGFSAFDLDTDGTGPFVLQNDVFYDIDDLEPWGGRLFSGAVTVSSSVVMGVDARDLEDVDASYSLFWDSSGEWEDHVDGPGNLFVDPMFVDPEAGDFHLSPGSPAIDAGDPDPALDDPDGSRNDIGRYGGA